MFFRKNLSRTMKLCLSVLCVFIHLFLYADELSPTLSVQIPMRDGVELPTDIYLPSPDARHLPCILIRSPSGRNGFWKPFVEIAKAGYVVAIQQTRSSLDVEGKTLPFMSDGWGKLQDGFDTVSWLAKSCYTNGKIGTWGASALGITQLLLAVAAPSPLVCQYVIFAAASLYHHGLFPGGQLLKHQAESWLGLYARDTGVITHACQRPFYTEFWKQLNTLEHPERIQVPAIHIGGWYDTFLEGTLSSFLSRQNQGGEKARGRQKLVIGPWAHFWPQSKKLGDYAVPLAGENVPFDISPKRWFDHYLKGIDNGVDELPPVIYYVMGPFDGSPSSGNVWRTSDVWPIPADFTSYYLTEQKTLSFSPGKEGKMGYDYHPEEPIVTAGGRNLFLDSGPKDQREIEKRKDVLVFTSPILEEDVEMTGPLSGTIYFDSDRDDTDLILRLCDVYPDGKSLLIAEGGLRTGVVCLNKKLEKGKPHPYIVNLSSTSIVFAKGHAIRVSVSSSNYPRYEKNMNLGLLGRNSTEGVVAKNQVFVGQKYPSHLLLPVIKKNGSTTVRPPASPDTNES